MTDAPDGPRRDPSKTTVLVVHWEWGPNTKFSGGRFWSAHGTDIDGRISDWPSEGLVPIGATEVIVADGEGLDLLRPIAERTRATRA